MALTHSDGTPCADVLIDMVRPARISWRGDEGPAKICEQVEPANVLYSLASHPHL
jgi:hypothetical protein